MNLEELYWDDTELDYDPNLERVLTEAGLDNSLEKLRRGNEWEAREDLRFYEFVVAAQAYLKSGATGNKVELRGFFPDYLTERRLTDAIQNNGASSAGSVAPNQKRLVDAVRQYIEENPPQYDEDYKSKLFSFFGAAGYQLIKAGLEERGNLGNPENIPSLIDREMDVLIRRLGIIDGRMRSLEEVGCQYGVTQERIRQIQDQALEKLGYHGTIDVRHQPKTTK